jgi:hypothetical protein
MEAFVKMDVWKSQVSCGSPLSAAATGWLHGKRALSGIYRKADTQSSLPL